MRLEDKSLKQLQEIRDEVTLHVSLDSIEKTRIENALAHVNARIATSEAQLREIDAQIAAIQAAPST